MNTQVFLVEALNLPQLVKTITDNELDNEIIGQTENGEYYISIDFKDEDLELIEEISEIAEFYNEDESEEDDE